MKVRIRNDKLYMRYKFYAITIAINLFAILIFYNNYIEVLLENEIMQRNEDIFSNIKSYIDNNMKIVRIYVANEAIKSDVNNKIILKYRNYGNNMIMSYDNKGSVLNTYTNDVAIDYIIDKRIVNDQNILVKNQTEANVIYVPLLLASLCNYEDNSVYNDIFHNMTLWLKSNRKQFKDKLILLVYSDIESSFYSKCLLKPETKDIFNQLQLKIFLTSLEECVNCNIDRLNYTHITIPYSTQTAFTLNKNKIRYEYDLNEKRLVDVLFAGKLRDYTQLTKFIIDNIDLKTNLTFEQYKSLNKMNITKPNAIIYNSAKTNGNFLNSSLPEKLESIMDAIEWKLNSKLCIEQYDDVQTKRSFWDSIMFGCIPVIFTEFPMPFSDIIDYTRFVIQIHVPQNQFSEIDFNILFQPFLENKEWLKNAIYYMTKIKQFLQYTWLYDNSNTLIDSAFKYDAYGILLAKLTEAL